MRLEDRQKVREQEILERKRGRICVLLVEDWDFEGQRQKKYGQRRGVLKGTFFDKCIRDQDSF